MALKTLSKKSSTGKCCKRCGLKKPAADFYHYRWVCKDCYIAKSAKYQEEHLIGRRKSSAAYYARNVVRLREEGLAWKKRNWDKVLVSARKSNRKRKLASVGATLSDFNTAIASQGGFCAICKTEEVSVDGGKHVHIDHCHQTGKFRGVLCSQCNKGLGHFRDNPEVLARAIAYLTRTLDATSPNPGDAGGSL